jgi:hypothetical protein
MEQRQDIARERISLQQLEVLEVFKERLVACQTLQGVVDTALAGARALHRAEFGNVQLLNPQRRSLAIVAQHGFAPKFLRTFQEVSARDSSACGRALHRRQPVIVADVAEDETFAPFRGIAASAGFRAVQSTPLIAGTGACVGVLSTHCGKPRTPSPFDMLLVRVLARRAADVVVSQRKGPPPAGDIWRRDPVLWSAACLHKSDEILLRAARSMISHRSAVARSESALADSLARLASRNRKD